MGKMIEIKQGEKYNRLTFIKEVEPYIRKNGGKIRKGQFKCDCGIIKNYKITNIILNYTLSCGCYHKELMKNLKSNTKHNKTLTPEYNTWRAMKQRCFCSKSINYQHYGGRGITVCDRWKKSFENFFEDMGKKPSPIYSMDRIDVNGNYEPNNCRWATPKEQAINKR